MLGRFDVYFNRDLTGRVIMAASEQRRLVIPPIRFVAFSILLIVLSSTSFSQTFTSPHFTLELLAPGVYAAIATDTGAACANAGIIDLGGKTLIFDTFLSPIAAQDLLKAAGELTGNPVTHIVNSHFHNDHIRGNQVFPASVEIISTKNTLESIARIEPEQITWELQNVPMLLANTQAALAKETDFYRRRDLILQLAYYKAINESDHLLTTRLPTLTFEHKLTIRGTRRSIDVLDIGGGHTSGDCLVVLPDERVAFAGDLVSIGMHPYLPDGSPDEWLETLQRLDSLSVETIVPGHGPVGRKSDIAIMKDYIKAIQKLANAMSYQGKGRESSTPPVPSQFRTWTRTQNFIQSVRFLVGRISKEK